jgi:hypothetical protein
MWQTGIARLFPLALAGRKAGPVFLTDRKALPLNCAADADPTTVWRWSQPRYRAAQLLTDRRHERPVPVVADDEVAEGKTLITVRAMRRA